MGRFRTERERLQYEAWKVQDDEELQRPIKQAAAHLERTAGALVRMQRSNLIDIRDPEFFVTPGLESISMEWDAAQDFIKQEATAFVQETPEYYGCQKNFEIMSDYMLRNGATIVDRAMWKIAFEKFKAVGLLDERPEPETVVESVEVEPDLDLPSRLPLSYQHPSGWKRESDGTQGGYDLSTGEPRVYTAFEIERMTADEYKRVFRLSIPALTKANFTQ